MNPRYLALYVLICDALLVTVGLPLERYALRAAAAPQYGPPLILALLAVNVLLLAIVLGAAVASAVLACRVSLTAARSLRRRSTRR